MPTFSPDEIRSIALKILQGAGVSEQDALVVATELVEANLVGHDSHGLIRLKQYVEFIEAGDVRPGALVQIRLDSPSIVVIDGAFNFGQLVVAKAMEIATARARQSGASAVLCRNTNHVGRLGSYTRRAALEGFVALMAVNGPGAAAVIPWGGLDRRYGTNPISIAAPCRDQPMVLDMTTSATAEGKLRVAYQKGQAIPAGWIIDKEGKPSTNPADYYEGGAILPLGGDLGHKGFGLGVMLDVLCGILSGAGVARKDVPPGNNGVWLHLIDVHSVTPHEDYAKWMNKYVEWIKSSRTAEGVSEILLPGEVEARVRENRMTNGIEIPDKTWQQTCELAQRLGVSIPGSSPTTSSD